MTEPLTVVDLFAGAGGLSEGFRATRKFKVVGAVELEPSAAATYEHNHPGTSVFNGDIESWLDGPVPRAHVVVGGPPCQGFSKLGPRKVRDPRNALWRRYVDTLERVRPLYFVLENVGDFLGSGQFRDLRRETHRGGRLYGYRIESDLLNAAEFGAPQLRRRAVIIGSRRDLPAPGLPMGPLHGRPDEWATVREAIGSFRAEVDGLDLPPARTEYRGRVLPGPFTTAELHLGRRPTQVSLDRYAAIPPGGNRHDIPPHLLARCWQNHTTGSGDVMGRLRWDNPSVTIRTEFWKPEKGRYLHPEADRALTHAEAARLQGFPWDYGWFGSKVDIGRQIGNAVPVPLATGIASHIGRQLVVV